MRRMRRSMLVKSRSSLMAFFTTVLLVSLGSASAGGKAVPDQLSPGEFKPFVTFNLTKTLHEHPSEE
jgi:hypothetical protein